MLYLMYSTERSTAQQVGSYLGYSGRQTNVVATAAHDPQRTFGWSAWSYSMHNADAYLAALRR
jgi:hypothetical protein